MTNLETLQKIATTKDCIGISCDNCPLMMFCQNYVSKNKWDSDISPNEIIWREANRKLDLITADEEIKRILE